ncbi:MAG TPA: hypothetical protein VLB68_09085 [Pyrinomonadaceae bacterium]|nr:hypothetical protein [Pyrinomonadaceae bacterium]
MPKLGISRKSRNRFTCGALSVAMSREKSIVRLRGKSRTVLLDRGARGPSQQETRKQLFNRYLRRNFFIGILVEVITEGGFQIEFSILYKLSVATLSLFALCLREFVVEP